MKEWVMGSVKFGWKNFEAFDIPPSFRHKMYHTVKTWWEAYKISPLHKIETSQLLSYHGQDEVVRTWKDQDSVFSIEVSETVVMSCS